VYEPETYLECYQQYMTLKEPWHSESACAKQWHTEALRVWAELISSAGAKGGAAAADLGWVAICYERPCQANLCALSRATLPVWCCDV